MAIEYQITNYRTCEGIHDADCNWFQLSATHTPSSGKLKQVIIPCRKQDGEFNKGNRYLGIWHELDDGSWVKIAVSQNATRQINGINSVWYFNNVDLEGRKLRLALLDDPDAAFSGASNNMFGVVVTTGDSDGCYSKYKNGNYRYLVDVTFTIENKVVVPDPEPEPETYQRVIDISKYWARVVRDTVEFQQLADAENPEFNRLAECIRRILQDAFILDATEPGVQHWETMLNLVPGVDDTLDERKVRVLTYLTVNVPYSTRVVKQMIASFAGEDGYTMNYDNEIATLTITLEDKSKLADVNALLERVLQQHIVYNIK